MGKEAREMRIKNRAYPNLMVPVTGRELAPAMEIYDPDPVAVAS
jgi:hypothetical protein